MILPTYSPDFGIRINGDRLAQEVRSVVTGVNYQEGTNESARVEIDIANVDLRWLQEHIRGLGIHPFPSGVELNVGPVRLGASTARGTFDIDNQLELEIGYATQPLIKVFEGDVTGIDVNFPGGGIPSLKLVAHDYLHRMQKGSKARGFGILPDFLVASILSAESQLVPLIDPTVVGASTALTVLQTIFSGSGTKQVGRAQGESNFDFLKRIAHRYDADFWVDGNVLFLSRLIKEFSPSTTLRWGESLVDFNPRVNSVGQIAGVSAKLTLREIPLSFMLTIFWDFDREILGVSVVPGQAAGASAIEGIVGGQSITKVDLTVGSPADIAANAMCLTRTLREKINTRVTGSGTAIGNPDIRVGSLMRLEGLGQDFSRDYRVTSAVHTIDSGGYKTNFEVAAEIIP